MVGWLLDISCAKSIQCLSVLQKLTEPGADTSQRCWHRSTQPCLLVSRWSCVFAQPRKHACVVKPLLCFKMWLNICQPKHQLLIELSILTQKEPPSIQHPGKIIVLPEGATSQFWLNFKNPSDYSSNMFQLLQTPVIALRRIKTY